MSSNSLPARGPMMLIRWYVLARLSSCALALAREADGSPPVDREACIAWFKLSDLAYRELRDGP